MTVHDCMREIRKATDAIDTIDKYVSGEMRGIAEQDVIAIREMLCEYIDMIESKVVD